MEQNEWVRQLRPPMGREEVRPASSADLLATATATIGADAVAWAVAAADELVGTVATALGDATTPVEMTGYEREACEACLLTSLATLTDLATREVHTPAEAINQVRMSVRQEIPIVNVVRTVWASHTMVQDALLGEAEQLLPPERVVPAARSLNERLFEIVNVYVRELMAEYEEELAVWRGDLSGDRVAVLDSVLEGAAPPDAERVLGLRLYGWHLLAQAWQATPGFVGDADADIGRFAASAARAMGASGALVLPRGSATVIWWTFRTAPNFEVASLRSELSTPGWMRLSLGETGRGVAGVQESYRGAGLARAAGTLADQPATPVMAYEDMRVVTLALGDSGAAQQFIRSVLRGALGVDGRTSEYRQAARAYIASGFSRQEAAKELQVSPNTVAYRVNRLGELLGRPVRQNPVETLIALEFVDRAPALLPDQLAT
jgi:hypothetical protein